MEKQKVVNIADELSDEIHKKMIKIIMLRLKKEKSIKKMNNVHDVTFHTLLNLFTKMLCVFMFNEIKEEVHNRFINETLKLLKEEIKKTMIKLNFQKKIAERKNEINNGI